jgi:hypothetical protein
MVPDDPTRPAIVCRNCGRPFRSRYGPGNVGEGNIEPCPHCRQPNFTPPRKADDPIPQPPPGAALRYIDGRMFPRAYQKISERIKSPSLSEITRSFEDNIFRLHNLFDLPDDLIFAAVHIGEFSMRATFEVTNTLYLANLTPEQKVAVDAKMHGMLVEYYHSLTPDQYQSKVRYIGEGNIAPLINDGGNSLLTGFQAILIAQINGVWSAFETLAGDLWEAALNAHPNKLADLRGSPNRIIKAAGVRSSASPSEEAGDGRKASLILSEMHKYSRGTFNLSGVMGSILRTRFKFSTLEGIRAAYSSAFNPDTHPQRIDTSLADKSLDSLSKVRNLFAHRSGIVDDKFLEEAQGLPSIPSLRATNRMTVPRTDSI